MANIGKVVYFDGPDGAGKTTQLKLVSQTLIENGYSVHVSRVLGGTPIGELLREAVLSQSDRPVETDLHIAMACQHALAVDLAANHADQIVLLDRSPLSVIAYQVYGDGLDKEIGFKAADELMALIKPDLTLLYTAPANALADRRHHRNYRHGYDFFENKPVDYHQRVVEGYEAAAKHFKAVTIDATQSIDEINDKTLKAIFDLIN